MVMCTTPDLQLFELRLFQDLIYRQAGIHLTDAKRALVQTRLRERLLEREVGSYGAYHRLVVAEDDELQQCIDALTTNETFFFRHQGHWNWFTGTYLREWLLGRAPHQGLRIWSAGCSSGEEAYTTAILLRDRLPADAPFVIDATDINASVLAQARQAEYGRYALQLVSDEHRHRCFQQLTPHRWRLRDSHRAEVRFARGNLLQPLVGPTFDLVFMRNVLIYFDEAGRRRALEQAHRRLRPGGVIVVGGSETLQDQLDLFTPIAPAIYRKREER